MKNYGVCNLNAVAMRTEPDSASEMHTQVLFGETFSIEDETAGFYQIKTDYDDQQGWIAKHQVCLVDTEEHRRIFAAEKTFTNELVSFLTETDSMLTPLSLGAVLPDIVNNEFTIGDHAYFFEGESKYGVYEKSQIVKSAFLYINSPFLHGGRTPFGIDSAGLIQMIYKINGHYLPRKSHEQAKLGEVLSFIEESEPGDLAFFDNDEGEIIHVGILLENNYIIHCHGKVRLDRLDQSGIFNVDTHRHTHKLRVIKKML